MFMFFAISVMEDSGYLARVAYMLDRLLRWFGLHGNSVIALLISGGISGGCAVPGVMATRTLRDPKERIATLLVVPFMNCGAKLPIFSLLIAAFFHEGEARMLFIFTLLSWLFALFAAKLLRSTVLKGPKTPFVMELPPYRAPTIKGLLIHTWERTWQYIKKAGTIILAISVVLWAMMTYPGLPEERAAFYDTRIQEIQDAFLARPEVRPLIPNEALLDEVDRLSPPLLRGKPAGTADYLEEVRKSPAFGALEELARSRGHSAEKDNPFRTAYVEYRTKRLDLESRRQGEALLSTAAGRIGHALEWVSAPLGFDYRVNISLVGGFAAKEVIVSTLGTAYSLGEVSSSDSGSLSSRLKKDPSWNPLRAFSLILFVMLYVPCFVTVVSIRKESSWRWALFSILFNLLVAYCVTLVVYQTGLALGIGTG
jgi:ferrous iron transport protein B